MSLQPQATDPDIARYRGDLQAYCADNLVIRTKAAVLEPFVFNAAQKVISHIAAEQMRTEGRVRIIVLKARQEGISTWTAARFYRRVTLYEHQNALVIADQRKRGQILFGIYELFDRRLPDPLRPAKRSSRRGWELYYDTVEGQGLNSKLTVETAMDVAAGRGATIQMVHASELGFWEKPEETWTALMQAVPDDNSEVIIESTANGVGNTFHQMWEDSEAGDSSFVPVFLPWWIHREYSRVVTTEQSTQIMESLSEWESFAMGVGFEVHPSLRVLKLPVDDEGRYHLAVEQIAWRRATIRDKLRGDENVFKQEYPATAREAFLVSGNCFFDEDNLLEWEHDSTPALGRFRLVERGGAIARVPALTGLLRVWEHPRVRDRTKAPDGDNVDGQYVIFADTATGKRSGERDSVYTSDREQGGRDFSAAWVYDITKKSYVAIYHGRVPPETFARQLSMLGYLYSHENPRTHNRIPALLGVERNHSSGETVVRILKDDLDYPNLFMDRTMNRRRNQLTQSAGWVSTEGKRAIMLDEFAAWLRDRTGKMPDADTIRECFTFIRDDTGKPAAQEGCHDDRVIAAAGCLQMARHHRPVAVPLQRRPVRRGGPAGHIEFEDEQEEPDAVVEDVHR
jgi:hypothetical protein